MTEKRFIVSIDNKNGVGLYDGDIRLLYFQFNNIQDANECKDALKHQCSLMNELYEENARLKSKYKVLHTQFQDLKKFLENNFNECLTRDKLQRQIIKLSDENEQLKKEILHKKNKEFKKEKKELCKYECKVKAFEEISELFKNGLIEEEHNDD